MKVMTHVGPVDYSYARVGKTDVRLVAGGIAEKLFFRVTDVSKIPRVVTRYESPDVYFAGRQPPVGESTAPLLHEEKSYLWDDDEDYVMGGDFIGDGPGGCAASVVRYHGAENARAVDGWTRARVNVIHDLAIGRCRGSDETTCLTSGVGGTRSDKTSLFLF